MIRTALYARVSTDEQVEKYGLSSQVTELRALARTKGYAIAAECLDDGYSGTTLERPRLTELRGLVRARAVDVVLIHDPDRLARKLAHQVLLLEELERHVRVEFLHAPAGDTLEGRLLRNVQGVIAEYEREKIRERTMRGRREKARRGLYAGPPPYGYRYEAPGSGRLIVHEGEAAIVRTMYRWLVEERRSMRSIARELQQLGVQPARGHHWGRSTVQRVLSEERYTGRAYFNRRAVQTHATSGKRTVSRPRPREEWIAVAIPRIIDDSLYEGAQAQLAQNLERINGRPARHPFLLTGLVWCGHCGHRLSGERRAHFIYRCAGRDRVPASVCRAQFHVKLVDQLVWSTVAGLLRRPDVLLAGVEAYHATLGARDVEIRSEAAVVQAELADVARQQERLLDLYQRAEFDVEALSGRMERLGARRRTLQSRATAIAQQAGDVAAAGATKDAVERACAAAVEGLEQLDEAGRHHLLVILVDRTVVHRDRVEIHGVLPAHELTTTGACRSQFPYHLTVALPEARR